MKFMYKTNMIDSSSYNELTNEMIVVDVDSIVNPFKVVELVIL